VYGKDMIAAQSLLLLLKQNTPERNVIGDATPCRRPFAYSKQGHCANIAKTRASRLMISIEIFA
jgi:hypothetical protein